MVLGEIQPRDVPDSLREKAASRLQYEIEPAAAPEFKVRVRVGLDGAVPEVELGPTGVKVDGELIHVRVSAPALAKTTASKKNRELVVAFPEGLFERRHWWHDRAEVLQGDRAPDGALPQEAKLDASDLGLLGDKPFRLHKPKFDPPGRGKAPPVSPRRGATLVARTALEVGQVVLREEPLLRAAPPAVVQELFSEQAEEEDPIVALAAAGLAAKRLPRERGLTLRRLALLQDLSGGEPAADVWDPLPGAGLTDAKELAQLLALLHAGSHVTDEEPCVFFALHLVGHSCRPNCVLVQDGKEYQLVAVEPVPAGAPLTLDLLQFPRAYQPQHLREAALVEAGLGHATPRGPSVRVFVCPACAKGALCPPVDGAELDALVCTQCGLEADAELLAECKAAETEHDEHPRLLVQPEGRLHPLHYLNVQLAATYLFELAPLHDQALRPEHRQVAELLVHACTRLRGTPCTPELRPLYQVLAVLWEYLNPDEEQLDEQRRYLQLVDELSAAFFPRACELDRQMLEKAFGETASRELGLITD